MRSFEPFTLLTIMSTPSLQLPPYEVIVNLLPGPRTPDMPTKVYTGGCHCGKFKFECRHPILEDGFPVANCNCSICTIKGSLYMYVVLFAHNLHNFSTLKYLSDMFLTGRKISNYSKEVWMNVTSINLNIKCSPISLVPPAQLRYSARNLITSWPYRLDVWMVLVRIWISLR